MLIIAFYWLDTLKLNGSSLISGDPFGESMGSPTSPVNPMKTAASVHKSTPSAPKAKNVPYPTASPVSTKPTAQNAHPNTTSHTILAS